MMNWAALGGSVRIWKQPMRAAAQEGELGTVKCCCKAPKSSSSIAQIPPSAEWCKPLFHIFFKPRLFPHFGSRDCCSQSQLSNGGGGDTMHKGNRLAECQLLQRCSIEVWSCANKLMDKETSLKRLIKRKRCVFFVCTRHSKTIVDIKWRIKIKLQKRGQKKRKENG